MGRHLIGIYHGFQQMETLLLNCSLVKVVNMGNCCITTPACPSLGHFNLRHASGSRLPNARAIACLVAPSGPVGLGGTGSYGRCLNNVRAARH